MPVVAIPSTKYLCPAKKRMIRGRIDTRPIAMIWFHWIEDVVSMLILRASDIGNFEFELI